MICEVKKAGYEDLDCILHIIEQAKNYLKEQGSPQWQGAYGPEKEQILGDIQRQEGYIFLLDGEIFGYAVLGRGIEESYSNITQGEWDNTCERYITIHRMAISSSVRGKGLARQMMKHLIDAAKNLGYRDIRVDTYPHNLIMERVILGAGFVPAGMVMLSIPHGERKAFQLVLKD